MNKTAKIYFFNFGIIIDNDTLYNLKPTIQFQFMLDNLNDHIVDKAALKNSEVDEFVLGSWLNIELYFDKIVLGETVYLSYSELCESKQYIDILTDEFKARLREMRHRMLKPVIALKRLKHSRIDFISLLFGLCSSESSLILDAYSGASHSRIPNL